MNWVLKFLSRSRRNENGAALTEFALVLPLLLILLVGTIEAGLLFQLKNSMTFHTRNVVRDLSLGNLTVAEAPGVLRGRLAQFANLEYQIVITEPTVAELEGEVTIFDYTVTVTVPPRELQTYSVTGIVSVPNFSTTATMRTIE